MKVGLVQVECALADKRKNIDKMKEIIDGNEADLFVFSETFLTGYMCRDLFFRLAEPLDGNSVQEIERIASEHGCYILFGMPVLDEEISSLITNSAVCVSPDGTVQRYDKLSLANFGPFEEKLYFRRGSRPALFEVGGFKVGPIICYDIFFPEISRFYALNGADAIICIAASPLTSKQFFERMIPARAIENTTYFLYVNQTGTQLNQVFFGGSQVSDPRGEIIAKCKYFEEDLVAIDIDQTSIRLARQMRPTLRNAIELNNLWFE